MTLSRLVASLSLVFVLASAAIAQERRIALVIGNDKYSAVPILAKAVNDAKAISVVMREIKFDHVIEVFDADRKLMETKIREFVRSIHEGDTVFFYYAGHGVAVGEANYLLPVDFPNISDSDDEMLFADEARSLDSVRLAIQSRKPGRVFMIVDACRNNPLASVNGRSIGRSRGLVADEPDSNSGVFMLFSAGFGQEALDSLNYVDQPPTDLDPNSVFTRSLLPLLRAPGLSQVDIAKSLQATVKKLARQVNHSQNPAYYDQIDGLFYLNGERRKPDEENAAAAAWQMVKDGESQKQLQAFIDRYGTNQHYRKLAEERLALLQKPTEPVEVIEVPVTEFAVEPSERAVALAEWQIVDGSADRHAVETFRSKYSKYPEFVALAVQKLAELDAQAKAAQEQDKEKSEVSSAIPGCDPSTAWRNAYACTENAGISDVVDVPDKSTCDPSTAWRNPSACIPSVRQPKKTFTEKRLALLQKPGRLDFATDTPATDCDRLAAHPYDKRKPASIKGLQFPQINSAVAIPACEEAMQKYPREARFVFQLARAYDRAKRYEIALTWYRKAADLGEAMAINNIGGLYRDGNGVIQNYRHAMMWYRRAADLGDASAVNNIGVLYEGGKGIEQDYREALAWYNKAADLGVAIAMYNIAGLYKNGRGVTQDYREAIVWYRKAADLDEASAMYDLGYLYDGGRHVEADFIVAAEWFYKALAAKHEDTLSEIRNGAVVWSHPTREAFQSLLKNEGLYAGIIDGKFGKATIKAAEKVFSERTE
jgi:uncharacterized protein